MINGWSTSIEGKSGCTCACACMHTRLPKRLNGREPTCQYQREGLSPWGEIPWRREWQPTLNSLAWESPGTEEPRGATAHRVTKSQTRPSTHMCIYTGNTLHLCLTRYYLSQLERSQDRARLHPLGRKAQVRHLF